VNEYCLCQLNHVENKLHLDEMMMTMPVLRPTSIDEFQ
jgi:hypothetical protein